MQSNKAKVIMLAILTTALACCCFIAFGAPGYIAGNGVGAYATDNNITIRLQIGSPFMSVNGREQTIDENGTTPLIQNNRTLMPVRAPVEAMGGTVRWDAASQTATLTHGDNTVRLIVGDFTAYLNDAPQTLDTAPVIVNSRTMLPIRFIAESFGFAVEWGGGSQEITITGQNRSSAFPVAGDSIGSLDSVNSADAASQGAASPSGPKILVAYFSQTGNTKSVAEEIHAQAGGDIFRIETAIPYSDDMAELVKRKNAELESGNMPELKASAENIESYDVIFIGYPIWAMTAPPPVRSFIQGNDLTGKIIAPFCTHDGYGPGRSVDVVKELLPDGTTILDAFDMKGSEADDANRLIASWLEGIVRQFDDYMK